LFELVKGRSCTGGADNCSVKWQKIGRSCAGGADNHLVG